MKSTAMRSRFGAEAETNAHCHLSSNKTAAGSPHVLCVLTADQALTSIRIQNGMSLILLNTTIHLNLWDASRDMGL